MVFSSAVRFDIYAADCPVFLEKPETHRDSNSLFILSVFVTRFPLRREFRTFVPVRQQGHRAGSFLQSLPYQIMKEKKPRLPSNTQEDGSLGGTRRR